MPRDADTGPEGSFGRAPGSSVMAGGVKFFRHGERIPGQAPTLSPQGADTGGRARIPAPGPGDPESTFLTAKTAWIRVSAAAPGSCGLFILYSILPASSCTSTLAYSETAGLPAHPDPGGTFYTCSFAASRAAITRSHHASNSGSSVWHSCGWEST